MPSLTKIENDDRQRSLTLNLMSSSSSSRFLILCKEYFFELISIVDDVKARLWLNEPMTHWGCEILRLWHIEAVNASWQWLCGIQSCPSTWKSEFNAGTIVKRTFLSTIDKEMVPNAQEPISYQIFRIELRIFSQVSLTIFFRDGYISINSVANL